MLSRLRLILDIAVIIMFLVTLVMLAIHVIAGDKFESIELGILFVCCLIYLKEEWPKIQKLKE